MKRSSSRHRVRLKQLDIEHLENLKLYNRTMTIIPFTASYINNLGTFNESFRKNSALSLLFSISILQEFLMRTNFGKKNLTEMALNYYLMSHHLAKILQKSHMADNVTSSIENINYENKRKTKKTRGRAKNNDMQPS